MKHTKRTICAALALVLVFSLAPAAFALEDVVWVSPSDKNDLYFTDTSYDSVGSATYVQVSDIDKYDSDLLVRLMAALRAEIDRGGISQEHADFYSNIINQIIRILSSRYGDFLVARQAAVPFTPVPAPVPGGGTD